MLVMLNGSISTGLGTLTRPGLNMRENRCVHLILTLSAECRSVRILSKTRDRLAIFIHKLRIKLTINVVEEQKTHACDETGRS